MVMSGNLVKELNPAVTFVVPCYNLAHLLPDCIESILSQTFRDFEILIMDDCSPDNTGEVARSFTDPRVKHIRNVPNLGHLRNYNKGLSLARGEYVWLISADDFLNSTKALDRYVAVMDRHPAVGYACAAGLELTSTGERHIAAYSIIAKKDTVFRGKSLLRQLLYGNSVLASSGLVRKVCYERLGRFPSDLPYAGDWYLWCLFAMHYDVAYFSDPLVTYRVHGNSMTDGFMNRDVSICVTDDLKVLWRLKEDAAALHDENLAHTCRHAIAHYYARLLVTKKYRGTVYPLSGESCHRSIAEFSRDAREATLVWARVNVVAGDLTWKDQDVYSARSYYRRALALRPSMAKVWAKDMLLRCGSAGTAIREGAAALCDLKR